MVDAIPGRQSAETRRRCAGAGLIPGHVSAAALNVPSTMWWRAIPTRERAGAQPSMRALRSDPAYESRAEGEALYWSNPPLTAAALEGAHSPAVRRFLNASYTGDEGVSWLEDLVRRGPFLRAAMLGSTEGLKEKEWLSLGGSRQLDVYDISRRVLERARWHVRPKRFGVHWPPRRARFFKADLNFVALPQNSYDVIWSSASLHHVINLEYLFDEIDGALCPGGLLAIHDYVGEARLQYAADRLARVNAVLREVPERFRLLRQIDPPRSEEMSPFEAVRSDETLGLAQQRFEVVHLEVVEALFPLLIVLKLADMEREAPTLLSRVFEAERSARRDPRIQRCSMYGVFRKRSSPLTAVEPPTAGRGHS